MRIRGRRVVLLIAGALPLLAVEDDVSQREAAAKIQQMQHQQDEKATVVVLPPMQPQHELLQQQHHHSPSTSTSVSQLPTDDELLYTSENQPTLLPLNLLQVESELVVGETQGDGFARGATKLQQASSNEEEHNEGIEIGVIKKVKDTAVTETVTESPDNDITKKSEEDELIDVDDEDDETGDDGTPPLISLGRDDDDNNNEISDKTDQESLDDSSKAAIIRAVDANEIEDEQTLETMNSTTTTIATTLEDVDDANLTTTSGNSESHIESLGDASATELEDAEETASIGETNNENKGDENETQQSPSPQVDQGEDEASISDRVAVDYASKSAGALVLEKSHDFKGTSNLLNGNRDKYAISPCNADKKFVVLSLSEDIYVKQVKLANYELYSSRVKDFQIQISQTMGNWVDLGIYTVSSDSGVQVIDLREPAWGRYLKFKFTSYYGDEFYCTLSQIMVHGSTMVQGFHEQLQDFNDEEDEMELGMAGGNPGSAEDDAVVVTPLDAATTNSFTMGNTGDGSNSTQYETDWDTEDDQDTTIPATDDDESEMQGDDAPNLGVEGTAAEYGELGSSSTRSNTALTNKTQNEDGDAAEDNLSDETEESTREEGSAAPPTATMSSKKDRKFSKALPAASVGVSSNVFSSIMGRLEPLHLKSVHELNKFGSQFRDSDPLNGILAKATDSTNAIKNALIDPAILEHLQVWNEATSYSAIAQIGPREQTLSEKLTAYIAKSDDKSTKQSTMTPLVRPVLESQKGLSDNRGGVDVESKQLMEPNPEKEVEAVPPKEPVDDPQAEIKSTDSTPFQELRDTDSALANLLDKLPSIQCLKGLDFAAFKEKALASRRGGHGHNGQAAAAQAAEPIFKMLTDQIKTLQSNLAVHDQFTKETVQCYQRVILDVVVEMQTLRLDHDERLSKLEQDLQETKTIRWVFVVYQMLMGFPNWASLLIATFFTSCVSPVTVSRPIEIAQRFLGEHLSTDEYFILKWTFLACIILLSAATTVSFCQRVLAKFKFNMNATKAMVKTKDLECEFTVHDAIGEETITAAAEPQSLRKLHVTVATIPKELNIAPSSPKDSRQSPLNPSSVATLPPCETEMAKQRQRCNDPESDSKINPNPMLCEAEVIKQQEKDLQPGVGLATLNPSLITTPPVYETKSTKGQNQGGQAVELHVDANPLAAKTHMVCDTMLTTEQEENGEQTEAITSLSTTATPAPTPAPTAPATEQNHQVASPPAFVLPAREAELPKAVEEDVDSELRVSQKPELAAEKPTQTLFNSAANQSLNDAM